MMKFNSLKILKKSIPTEVKDTAEKIKKAGFEAYLVGGCVRDLFLKRFPKDWDIATNATPQEIQKIFPESIYENRFGTVGVKTNSEKESLKVIEVTTFRLEGKYTDKRHPDEIRFAETIEEDLARRDFTINAIALDIQSLKVIDPYEGRKDLKNRIIRTVGESKKRFSEDALRLLRAVRLAVELDFEIEAQTAEAIKEESRLLEMIAKERIRDELVKILMTPAAAKGILLLEDLNLLQFIIPELREGIGCTQNKHHIYTVFEHNIRSLDYAAYKNYSLEIRLAALLHDIGKPRTKVGEGPDSTFYNHEIVGAKMTFQILNRLKFSKEIIKKVTHLVRYHLFYYNVGEVTEAGVRRFIRRVGIENIADLIKIREADRIGSGVPKAIPYKLRHLLFMIEKVKRDPIHPKMLAVKGDDVMRILKIEPGPKVGQILSILLEDILEDPTKNTKEFLELKIKELGKLSANELEKMAQKAKEKKEEFELGIEEEIKKKYYIK